MKETNDLRLWIFERTYCNILRSFRRLGEMCCLYIHGSSEDGGNTFLRNVGTSSDYTASRLTKSYHR